MTTENTFPDLNEAEIEEIVARVEKSRPWNGPVRSVELFMTKLYTTITFTILGTHFCFSPFSFLSSKQVSWAVFVIFVIMDIYFYFNKNKFDRRNIADWTRAILKKEDFSLETGYGYLKWTTLIYIPLVILVCIFSDNLHMHYSLAFGYTFIMAIWYKWFNVFVFWNKQMHDYKYFISISLDANTTLPYLIQISIITTFLLLFSAPYFIDIFKSLSHGSYLIYYVIFPFFYIFAIILQCRHNKIAYISECLPQNFNLK